MLIDSHAHLDSQRYDEDRDALLARAWQAGVGALLSIGIGDGPDTMHRALELSRTYAGKPETPRILASAGVHPHEAQLANEAALAKLDHLLQQPEVIACGEVGLDYFYDHSPRETQKTVFRRQTRPAGIPWQKSRTPSPTKCPKTRWTRLSTIRPRIQRSWIFPEKRSPCIIMPIPSIRTWT